MYDIPSVIILQNSESKRKKRRGEGKEKEEERMKVIGKDGRE